MSGIQIQQLPAASPLTGTEAVPVAQAGVTVQTTPAAIAGLGGGLAPRALRRVTGAGAVTVLKTDGIIVIAKTVGGATAVVLPSSPVAGEYHTIKDGKGDAATNPITITPAAGFIDGQASLVMNIGWESVNVEFDGVQWGGC